MNNIKYYKAAREISELEFIDTLRQYNFTNIKQTEKEDDLAHTDVIATSTINCKVYRFDVKDLSEKNRRSPNYSISEAMFSDVMLRHVKYLNHYLACKEYENDTATGRFILIPTRDIISNFIKKINKQTNEPFYLINVKEYIEFYQNVNYVEFPLLGDKPKIFSYFVD